MQTAPSRSGRTDSGGPVVSCGNQPHPTLPKSCHMTISAGQAMITMCPRTDTHLRRWRFGRMTVNLGWRRPIDLRVSPGWRQRPFGQYPWWPARARSHQGRSVLVPVRWPVQAQPLVVVRLGVLAPVGVSVLTALLGQQGLVDGCRGLVRAWRTGRKRHARSLCEWAWPGVSDQALMAGGQTPLAREGS